MSQLLCILMLITSFAFAEESSQAGKDSSAETETSEGAPGGQTAVLRAPAPQDTVDLCSKPAEKAEADCAGYFKTQFAQSKENQKRPSTMELSKAMRKGLEGQIQASKRQSKACIDAANQCALSCARSNSSRAQGCASKGNQASLRHRDVQAAHQQTIDELKEFERRIANEYKSSSPNSEDPKLNLKALNIPSNSAAPSASDGNKASPSQTGAKDSQPERTAEQRREDRRNERAEQRRNERINALSQAFMALGQLKTSTPQPQVVPTAAQEPHEKSQTAGHTAAEKNSDTKTRRRKRRPRGCANGL